MRLSKRREDGWYERGMLAASRSWGGPAGCFLLTALVLSSHGGVLTHSRPSGMLRSPVSVKAHSPQHVQRGGSAPPLLRLRGGADGQQQMVSAGGPGVSMEQLVLSLTSADNTERTDAESKYNTVKTENPDDTCTSLLSLLTEGQAGPEARGMAAVLARTDFSGMWENVSASTQEQVKQKLLLILQVYLDPSHSFALSLPVSLPSFFLVIPRS